MGSLLSPVLTTRLADFMACGTDFRLRWRDGARDANAAVVDAILALPAKCDPLRVAALTALPTSDRACALPGLARDIDRLLAAVTEGDASQKRRVEKMPAASKASSPALLAAYAAVRQRRRDRFPEIAAVRSSSSLGNRP